MEKVIEILRKLADGVRGPLVHELIDELEREPLVPGGPPAAPRVPPRA